jgi:hypothetical protein
MLCMTMAAHNMCHSCHQGSNSMHGCSLDGIVSSTALSNCGLDPMLHGARQKSFLYTYQKAFV